MVTTLARPILHLLAGLLFIGIPAVTFDLACAKREVR
jgi:hypothetical protein